MAGVIRNVTDLNEYLADRKWLFHERGMIFVWNELKTLFGATVVGAPTPLGPADFVTNFTPDFAERGGATGRASEVNGNIIDPPTQSL